MYIMFTALEIMRREGKISKRKHVKKFDSNNLVLATKLSLNTAGHLDIGGVWQRSGHVVQLVFLLQPLLWIFITIYI